jgi:hypothetical protein
VFPHRIFLGLKPLILVFDMDAGLKAGSSTEGGCLAFPSHCEHGRKGPVA